MAFRPGPPLTRRRFVGLAATGVAGAATGGTQLLFGCDPYTDPTPPGGRTPLPAPRIMPASSGSLIAAPGTARSAVSESVSAWLFDDMLPGPTIRARRGEEARIRLLNRLPEPTIVHWHGLRVPPEADGHPGQAISPGATYDYAFPVDQRAGTFWYHPHPHHRTAAQIHRGLAGFFIVSDEEEDALTLPLGEREILLLLQDRDDGPAAYDYAPTSADLHTGMLRRVPYGNGVRRPTLNVMGVRYRFRVLNASQARIYRLGLSDGGPLRIIGNDGGLLPAPVEVDSVYLGVGERIDCLLDLTALPVGETAILKSLPFNLPAGADGSTQGQEMDLLELVRVAGASWIDPPLPATLSSVPPLGPAAAERVFVFSTDEAGSHRINGREFEMDRIDERVSLGQVERWIFQNDSGLPHPVHLHGTHFQVESRLGGRATVYPYERGWKDTVLVMPLETVAVRVRFERYRGIFILHCHNLQHEDGGMMLNVEVT
jgi:FtsP/CotA-like multicopper oxidase with cupredoxin domain